MKRANDLRNRVEVVKTVQLQLRPIRSLEAGLTPYKEEDATFSKPQH